MTLWELSVAVPRSDTSCSRSISPRASVPLNAHYYSSHSVFVIVFTPCFCAASLLALMPSFQSSRPPFSFIHIQHSTSTYCNPDSNSCLSPAVILYKIRLPASQTCPCYIDTTHCYLRRDNSRHYHCIEHMRRVNLRLRRSRSVPSVVDLFQVYLR